MKEKNHKYASKAARQAFFMVLKSNKQIAPKTYHNETLMETRKASEARKINLTFGRFLHHHSLFALATITPTYEEGGSRKKSLCMNLY
jgi:hypothetical protein